MNVATDYPEHTFTVEETHSIALAPRHRLIRHSPDLGWKNVYASLAVHEPYRATLPAKKHNCVAFCLHRSAKVVRSIEGRDGSVDRILPPRHFGIIPSGTPSHWNVSGSPEMLLIYLRDSMMERVANEVFNQDLDSLHIIPRLAEVDPLLEQLAMSMLEVLRKDEARSDLYIDSLAYTMSAQLLRKHATSSRNVRPPCEAQAPRAMRMQRLEEFIEHALEEDLGLDRLASEAGLSPFYFVGAFTKSFGVSPHQYVLRKRIERAQSLLRTTDMPIADLALLCGFSSQSHLTSTFKRVVGVPPRAYRTNQPA